ncbi:MAG TPA: nicotinate phosphoribosyltransferase [Vicinamibacteria bacterium]|jgi:nicotinate phosphoribosyltransferase|nr:nicotinate phosphoribosyltransferase [Vicinamibacteria bacterium]
MSVFDRRRLPPAVFKLDVERMRKGWYSDKYFINIAKTLAELAASGYRFGGKAPDLSDLDVDLQRIDVGSIEVEMQWFPRRQPSCVVVGVDKALAMLAECTGYFEGERFVSTFDRMEVWAVHDGSEAAFEGDVLNVTPVMRVRGRYRDFAILETPTLGALTRGSRVATNVYEVMKAARGKQVLFFPARFDAHEVQAADGYAYQIGVQLFNQNFGKSLSAYVSTDAQGDWWGGAGGGTVAHAAIACFLGDTAEATMAFAATRPAEIPRIALVDFRNDCVGTSLEVIRTMFRRYLELVKAGRRDEARKYKLYGVRPDTASNMRDVSVPPLGDDRLDYGVNPRLVFAMREAIDREWTSWNLSGDDRRLAEEYCRDVKIAVTGGFTPARIRQFEQLQVPADIYGVGSWLLSSCDVHGTNNDFTADIVRVKIDGRWYDLAKAGRKACDNLLLERVQ